MALNPDPKVKLDSAEDNFKALLASEKHRAKYLGIYTILERNHTTARTSKEGAAETKIALVTFLLVRDRRDHEIKETKRETVTDAVYSATADVEDGSD